MTRNKTTCPYCYTINLISKQMKYVDEFGIPTFQCLMCKKVFTDISLREEINTEKLQTT